MQVHVEDIADELSLHCKWCSTFGLCGANCNQKHNIMSSLSLLPIYFHTMVDNIIHCPHQNYVKDHVANVRGAKRG